MLLCLLFVFAGTCIIIIRSLRLPFLAQLKSTAVMIGIYAKDKNASADRLQVL